MRVSFNDILYIIVSNTSNHQWLPRVWMIHLYKAKCYKPTTTKFCVASTHTTSATLKCILINYIQIYPTVSWVIIYKNESIDSFPRGWLLIRHWPYIYLIFPNINIGLMLWIFCPYVSFSFWQNTTNDYL